MASVPSRALDTSINRRMAPRSSLQLKVSLRWLDAPAALPAAIVNLSRIGFLAEIPERVRLPERLEADLPGSPPRGVQVVWTSGPLAVFKFLAPLSTTEIGAARLKSDFRAQNAAANSRPPFSIGPSDPIWDMVDAAAGSDRSHLRFRVLLIAVVASSLWASIAGLVALLA